MAVRFCSYGGDDDKILSHHLLGQVYSVLDFQFFMCLYYHANFPGQGRATPLLLSCVIRNSNLKNCKWILWFYVPQFIDHRKNCLLTRLCFDILFSSEAKRS